MTEGLRPSRVSVREEGRTTFLSDENRNSAMRFRSRTRSSSAEEVEAMPFARDLGLIDDHQEWTPEEWPESRPGEIPIRRLSYPVMQWLHQQGLLMTGWEKYPHLFLDFSDDLFSLATMQPLDFRWRRKEGEDRSGPGARLQRRPQELELIVGKLKTLKLDNNKLRDSDFDPAKDVGIASSAFASLRTLSLSKNLLVYPIIVLPRLKELDLSHNRLIQVPVLSGLAQLETLNLSHNKIEELEPKSFRDGKASNLRSLDLRFNRLQVFPKDLHGVFDEFARSSQMHTLRLSQNPFCCIFPEYHMLAALSMPRLRSLDKVTLTGHWRSELLRYGGSFFGMAVSNYVTGDGKLLESVNSVRSFPDSAAEPLPEVNRLLQLKLGVEVSSMDKARVFFLQDRVEDLAGQVKDRERIADNGGLGVGVSRKTIQRSRMATTDQEIPLLSSMTHELDSAIAGHTLIINSSTIVFQKASHLASLAADRVEAMFDDIKVKMNVKTGKMDPHLLRVAREDASKTFAEQVCMLAERHPDLRSILIRTLAKCGSISNEIGPPCMNSLALLAQADDETRRAVLEVTQEIILPAMQEGQIVEVANMNCEGMEDILESAVPEISAAVKSILRSGVNSKMLVKMMRSCEAAIRLLEIAVRSEAAALRVIKEDVLKAIVEYLSIDSVFLDKSACWIFVSGVHVLLGCLEHHRKEALASLSSAGLSTHLELLQNMEELGKSKETPGPALCRKAGSTMELLASLAQEDDTLDELMAYGNGARVSIEENSFVRVALAAPSAPSTADPVQLAGAMKCLITVLYNEKQWNRFGKYIVSHLELMDKKKNKIWGYIDGTHWREISRSCEMYKKHEENAKDPSRGYGTSELMNFQGVTDPNRIRNVFMHKMLVSVIDFLKAFSALADGDSKELCTRVSQVFNEMGRESVLFKLLQVPSTEVQEAVMGCLQYARLEELDDEEVQQLLHMLNPEIVESGERLLGAVLRNLTQFLEKDGEAADKFRRNHTRSVIDRTFKVLCTNCSRETFGNPDEEEQKITLSEQCVQVLITASFQPLLRRHLRGEVAKDFLKMLKDHETLDSWNCRDMNLELTWTGRHLDLLLSCLNTASPMCLRNDMKQAFRVFHRIANVMAGVGDTPDMARTAEERAAEETVMWNEKLMRQEANLLDDVAYDDQLQQQLIFFSFSGIERMVHFLEMPPEDGRENLVEETPSPGNKKSDRSVAIELQQQARSYLEELMADVKGSNEALRQRSAKSAEREDPETVEMGDVEIVHPGAVGEQLLREVFALEGWQSLSAPEEDVELPEDPSAEMQQDEVGQMTRQTGGIANLLEDLFQRGQQSFWTPEVCPVALPHVSKRLQRTNSFFIPGSSLVQSSFFVSALLRTIFAALTLPSTESVSSLVNLRLRNPIMQLRLITLLEKSGSYLDCHLAAKLMRILSMVLRLHPDESSLRPEENEWQHCIGLVIAAGCCGRVLQLLEPLLKHLGRGFELEYSHLVLAREAVRLVQTITSTVSRIHFSQTLELQKHALEVMVLDLIPMPTMKVIVMILLYDMQVAANVQGSKDAACRNLRWQELHGLCSETLSQLMHLAPSIRYEAVELMNRHKVLGHKQLHTFISDLLDRSEMHRLVRAFDLLLPELEDYQPNERVLQLAWAEMPEEGAKSFFSMAMGLVRTGGARLVALTTHRLIILGQSRHGAAKRPCGLCPPESFCPIGPEIFKSYSYADLTRIYSSDAQLLILGRTERRNREVTAEKFDMFIFHQVDAQREFKERLMVLSGLDPLMRIKLHQEMLVNRAAKSKTASRIARTTWGFRQSEEGERLSLFLLTELNFFEFQANFSLWIPNSVTEEKAYGSDNEYDGGESDEEAQEFTKASDFSKAMAKAAKDARTSKFSHERREQEEPILLLRQSERQERRYQDPPNKWLLDGIATEKAVSDTLWKYLPEAEIQQIKKDRSQGLELTEQELFEVPGASREKEIKHMHQVMKDKRKAILTQLFKCPIRNLKSVSFDPGPIPILHLTFQPDHGREEQVDIRFLDDCARESWRRNLQLVLQKTFSGGSQWGRVYDDHREDAARHAVKTNRAAKFFAHD